MNDSYQTDACLLYPPDVICIGSFVLVRCSALG